MNRMKHLISIVFLMVWMASALQAFGSLCSGDHLCCSENKMTEHFTFADACGTPNCQMIGNLNTDRDIPLLTLKPSLSNPTILGIVAYSDLSDLHFSSDFNLLVSNIDPPRRDMPLYVRHQQFLI